MWRLGTVPYLNALPLIDGLATEPDVELIEDLPSRLAPRARSGDLDLALVSSVELFRRPQLAWVDGPAITSRGPVRSILLFLRTEPDAIRTLALDTSSLTAAALARICLTRFLELPEPAIHPAPPDVPLSALDADAVLRIGDPALCTAPEGREVLDLGGLWTEHTGLPFVYALWLGRPASGIAGVVPVLERAQARGVANRHALAERFAAKHSMDVTLCREYLDDCIGYTLGDDEREGLRLFGRLAHECGLVDAAGAPPPLS